VINELSAASSTRLLRWDPNGQPYVGAGHPWWSAGFQGRGWETGAAPVGFGFDDIATDLGEVLRDVSPSLYARKEFTASAADAASVSDLVLTISYNDGFIAWINGVEVGRANMGAAKAHIYSDQRTYRGLTSDSSEEVVAGTASGLLVEGTNVIAVQVNNFATDTTSVDGRRYGVTLRLDMSLALAGGGTEFFPLGSEVSYFPGLIEPTSDVFEPGTLSDPEAEDDTSDWVELHNTGAAEMDLSGWSLTDDKGVPDKWRFPAGTTVTPGGFLVVLADEMDPGTGSQTEYAHASFKLASGGEFLGLFDGAGAAQDAIDPAYPEQPLYYSYGRDPAGAGFVYFGHPTPGGPNAGETFEGQAGAPQFDHEGGFYDDTVVVTLTSGTPGATIRYTTDGTEPELDNGTVYAEPLSLARVSATAGHVIRARTFADGLIPSDTESHTFLVGQNELLRSSAALAFATDLPKNLYDPYGALAIGEGTSTTDNWVARRPGDYNNVRWRGRPYERMIHAEFYFPDGTVGFRSDCGVRAAVSSWSRPRMTLNNLTRSPWESNDREKPSFNLYFRDSYGNPDVSLPLNGENAVVDTFEGFRVRAGKNDINNPFVIDELVRRAHRDMGNVASTGLFNSLYVNGALKGYYNTVERLRAPFFSAHHGSEPGTRWDVLAHETGTDDLADGTREAWDDMIVRLNAPVTAENWQKVLEVADVTNMADYYLLNIYAAMWDWPHNNWAAAKERSPSGRYRLYIWDAEGGMGNAGDSTITKNIVRILNTRGSPPNDELQTLWQGLVRWDEYRILFADRINQHMFNGGVLDDRDPANSYLHAMESQLHAEFADLLMAINRGRPVPRMTNWARADRGRRAYLLGPRNDEFAEGDLWPAVAPPAFSQFGGSVPSGFPLTITSEGGAIHYTTDGTDPRLYGGATNPSATAVSEPAAAVTLTGPATVMARSYQDGTWSALTTATFTIDTVPASTANFGVVELLYNPVGTSAEEEAAGFTDGDQFEFIQLQNLGGQAIDLRGVRFSDGVDFDFSTSAMTSLPPGAYAIVVSDLAAFQARYGNGFDALIAGQYTGRFNNDGESVRLIGAGDEPIQEFTYGTGAPWPDLSQLDGHSIQVIDPTAAASHADPANWQASAAVGGSPGSGGVPPPLNFAGWLAAQFSPAQLADPDVSGPDADTDGDRLTTFAEFALGTPPLQADAAGRLPTAYIDTVGDDTFLAVEFTRGPGTRLVRFNLQVSPALGAWTPTPSQIASETSNADGSTTVILRETTPIDPAARPARYVRLHMAE
jgi:hypothetical protein